MQTDSNNNEREVVSPFEFLERENYIKNFKTFIKDISQKIDNEKARTIFLQKFGALMMNEITFALFVTKGLLPFYDKDKSTIDREEIKKREEDMRSEQLKLILGAENIDNIEEDIEIIKKQQLDDEDNDKLMRYFELFCYVYANAQ